jgi:hypothetical protein
MRASRSRMALVKAQVSHCERVVRRAEKGEKVAADGRRSEEFIDN